MNSNYEKLLKHCNVSNNQFAYHGTDKCAANRILHDGFRFFEYDNQTIVYFRKDEQNDYMYRLYGSWYLPIGTMDKLDKYGIGFSHKVIMEFPREIVSCLTDNGYSVRQENLFKLLSKEDKCSRLYIPNTFVYGVVNPKIKYAKLNENAFVNLDKNTQTEILGKADSRFEKFHKENTLDRIY